MTRKFLPSHKTMNAMKVLRKKARDLSKSEHQYEKTHQAIVIDELTDQVFDELQHTVENDNKHIRVSNKSFKLNFDYLEKEINSIFNELEELKDVKN